VITAEEIMTTDVKSIRNDAPVYEALSLMIEHGVSGLPVVDADGQLVGVVSEYDLLVLLCDCEEVESDLIHDYMSTDVRRVAPDTDWKELADVFRTSKLRRLPVTKGDALLGIVSRRDVMRRLQKTRSPAPSRMSSTNATHIKLKCHVLLVEDGRANTRFLAHVLRRAGARVKMAGHGQDAVDLVERTLCESSGQDERQEPFDIVLMDMDMPVMDGREATGRLREMGFDRPIIALTGLTENYARQECLDAGCDDYVAKPYDRNKLVKIIHEHLEEFEQDSRAGDSSTEGKTSCAIDATPG
jgi:CheY-like chemotaxis protein